MVWKDLLVGLHYQIPEFIAFYYKRNFEAIVHKLIAEDQIYFSIPVNLNCTMNLSILS